MNEIGKKIDNKAALQKFICTDDINLQASIECGICYLKLSKKYDSLNNMMLHANTDICELAHNNNWCVKSNICYCEKCADQYNRLKDISNSSNRPDKIAYYLNIAKEVSSRSTCLRRHYGAILVKNDIIIATGYNGAPRETLNCIDLNECRREKLNIPRGACYEMCRAVHAEQNCIINASREKMIDSDLYLYGIEVNSKKIIDNLDSCQMCKKLIINAGIKQIIFARPNGLYEIKQIEDWIINDETLTDKFGY